jgi:hypothetical protein
VNSPWKKKTKADRSSWISISEWDRSHSEPSCSVEDLIELYCIDLWVAAAQLKPGDPTDLKGKRLGELGWQWLELLRLLHWNSRDGYIIPQIVESGCVLEMQSALEVMEKVSEADLRAAVE